MSIEDLDRRRKNDSLACRARIEAALARLQAAGVDVSPGLVAAEARVHRSFLYRAQHQDLLAKVKRVQGSRPATPAGGRITDPGLKAENANLRAQNQRLKDRLSTLERRLGEVLGQEVHAVSGLGSGDDGVQLQRRLDEAEEQIRSLRRDLEERDDALRAARDANRQLLSRSTAE